MSENYSNIVKKQRKKGKNRKLENKKTKIKKFAMNYISNFNITEILKLIENEELNISKIKQKLAYDHNFNKKVKQMESFHHNLKNQGIKCHPKCEYCIKDTAASLKTILTKKQHTELEHRIKKEFDFKSVITDKNKYRNKKKPPKKAKEIDECEYCDIKIGNIKRDVMNVYRCYKCKDPGHFYELTHIQDKLDAFYTKLYCIYCVNEESKIKCKRITNVNKFEELKENWSELQVISVYFNKECVYVADRNLKNIYEVKFGIIFILNIEKKYKWNWVADAAHSKLVYDLHKTNAEKFFDKINYLTKTQGLRISVYL